jgi:hypothetical protein
MVSSGGFLNQAGTSLRVTQLEYHGLYMLFPPALNYSDDGTQVIFGSLDGTV